MPLNLIWTVQITRREKMGLAAVFSVGVIIIVFAVVCTAGGHLLPCIATGEDSQIMVY